MSQELTLIEQNLRSVSESSAEEIRAFISNVEDVTSKLPQIDIPLNHYFSKGTYAREIVIPKGSFIVGKIHKFENLNIISKGEVSVLSIEGLVKMKAPCTFVSSVGVKRMIFAHEETVWTTIHGTSETDLEKIESEVIASDYSEVSELPGEMQKCLG